MDIKHRFVSGILTGMGSVVLKTSLNLMLIPIIIRQLGGEGYGLYVLLVGLLELVLMLDMGFTTGIMVLLGKLRAKTDPDSVRQGDDLMALGQWLYGGLSILGGVLGLLLLPYLPHWFHIPAHLLQLTQVCLMIILGEAVITLYQSFFRAILLAHCATHWTNMSESLYHILGNGVGLILVLNGFGVPGLLGARLGAAIVRCVIMAVQAFGFEGAVLSKRLIPPWPANAWPSFRQLFRQSSHAMLLGISIYISHGIDQIVIARFLPLRAVGVYEIVFRFMQISVSLGTKMCEGLIPLFGRLSSTDTGDQARTLFLRMSFLNNFVTSAILTTVVCFYPDLFSVFTGDKIPIAQTIPILLIALPIFWSGALQLPCSYYLYTNGKEKFLTISSLVTAAANLCLSLILVQYFGLVGVALGTMIPQVVQHQLNIIPVTRKALNIGLWEYIQAVHLRVLVPLASAALWMVTIHPLIKPLALSWFPPPNESASHWLMLSLVAVVAMSGLGIAFSVWIFFMAADSDRQIVIKVKNKMMQKLKKQPAMSAH